MFRFISWLIVILGSFCWAGNASALLLQNGDFSDGPNGFAGWTGQLFDSSTLLPTTLTDPGTDSHFTATGDGFAELTNDFSYFGVGLFQDFDIPSTVGTLTLSFDYSWMATDTSDSGDLVSASLAFGLDSFDLFEGKSLSDIALDNLVSVDITAFAGESSRLEFFLFDRDFNENELLRIGNIQLTENVQPIPEPGTFALMLAGLLSFLVAYKSSTKGNKFRRVGKAHRSARRCALRTLP